MEAGAALVLGVGAVLAALQAAVGYFYARHYREQREFRRWVYENVHALDKRLERNCALTEEMHRRLAVMAGRG